MSRRGDKPKAEIRGGMLIRRGEVIHLMDQGVLIKCRVISCLAMKEGSCWATLEILEGERSGVRIDARLRPGDSPSVVDVDKTDIHESI
jgi:hypothetical protein